MGLVSVDEISIARCASEKVDAESHAPCELPFSGKSSALLADDLTREVYGLLGIPVDAVDMQTVLSKIDAAAQNRSPLFISTPNLNFLVTSRWDAEFRETLLSSDLCPADGMPVVWLSRLMGIPLTQRIAGSDIFVALKFRRSHPRSTRAFLFGGAAGVAAKASERLNAESGPLTCVGHFDPGFCSVDEMSTDLIIDTINASHADFLSVSLGAKKGQSWLSKNNHRITVPVRAHLGAVINFQAGTLKRAPKILQRYGLEWAWRIKEEPFLWRRYFDDLCVLVRLLLTRVLPLAIATKKHRLAHRQEASDLRINRMETDGTITLNLHGEAVAQHVGNAARHCREALESGKKLAFDLSETSFIDARFIGLFLMVRKQLRTIGHDISFASVPRRIERLFRLNEFAYLLDTSNQGGTCPRHA